MRIPRSIKVRWRYLLRYITRARMSSHEIAWGFAIGLFVAWTPTFGFQMLIAAALATLLRGSRMAAMASTWLTNVFTAIPFYTAGWRLGCFTLDGFQWTPADHRADKLATMLQGDPGLTFWQNLGHKLAILRDFGVELWLGCAILGVITAALSYPILLRLIEGQRLVAAQRRAKRLRRRTDEHEQVKFW